MDKLEIENQQPQNSLIQEVNTIVEKIVNSKGWSDLYQKIRQEEIFPPIIIYKMLYNSNGDEEKVKEKIAHRKAKLQKKLKKHNLEAQFLELIKKVEVFHPKMAFHILKMSHGNVELSVQKIQSFSAVGSHKQQMAEFFKIQFPNYQNIIEDLLSSGYILPIPFFLKMMYMFQGDLAKMKEYLKSENLDKGHKFWKKQFKCKFGQSMGGCEKFKKKRCGGKKERSNSSSESSESEAEYDDQTLDDFAKGNQFLIQNGFTDSKQNLQALKECKCDAQSALRYLIKKSLNKDKKQKSKSRHHRHHKRHHKRGKSSSGSSRSSSSSSSGSSRSRNRSKDKRKNNKQKSSSRSSSSSKSPSRKHKHHHRGHHHSHHQNNEHHPFHPFHHQQHFDQRMQQGESKGIGCFRNRGPFCMPPPPPPHFNPMSAFNNIMSPDQHFPFARFQPRMFDLQSNQNQNNVNEYYQEYLKSQQELMMKQQLENLQRMNQNINNNLQQEQLQSIFLGLNQANQQQKPAAQNNNSSEDVEILIKDTKDKLNISD